MTGSTKNHILHWLRKIAVQWLPNLSDFIMLWVVKVEVLALWRETIYSFDTLIPNSVF